MQTKSKIQIIGEALNEAHMCKDSIMSLMDRYTIEDSIFVEKLHSVLYLIDKASPKLAHMSPSTSAITAMLFFTLIIYAFPVTNDG